MRRFQLVAVQLIWMGVVVALAFAYEGECEDLRSKLKTKARARDKWGRYVPKDLR